MALPVPIPALPKLIVPLPFVTNACPFDPSDVGRVRAVTNPCRFASYAKTSDPIATPKFVLDVDALPTSDKLFAANKPPVTGTVANVDVRSTTAAPEPAPSAYIIADLPFDTLTFAPDP